MTSLADANVERIGVFRALALGDLLCATPALRALKRAYPGSELTLIGLASMRALAERLPCVDRFIDFPGHPGLPEIEPDLPALPGFVSRMQSERFDLLVQMHGSGSIVNPLLASFHARRVAGFTEPGIYCANPELHIGWPPTGHEIERMLGLIDHLGIPRAGVHLDFPITDADHADLERAVPEPRNSPPFVCMHPGVQLHSRRWMPERFARVADALAQRGCRIVLTGTASESDITAQVQRHRHLAHRGRRAHAQRGGQFGRRCLALVGARSSIARGAVARHVLPPVRPPPLPLRPRVRARRRRRPCRQGSASRPRNFLNRKPP
jgi:ADP-heptose:LPS heptosyltransferase